MLRRLAVLFLCAASAACAAGPDDPAPAPVELPLDLTVDSVTLRRGGIRLGATMADGSADVSVWPGATCRQRELGRGYATPDELAWNLTAEDVAVGMECGLVVRARTRGDDGKPVTRVASLTVDLSMQSDAPGARVHELTTEGAESRVAFLTLTRAYHAHVAGVVVGARDEGDQDKRRFTLYQRRVRRPLYRSSFDVANVDLARALVQQRPVAVGGVSFDVSVAIGGVGLDLELPEDES